MILDTLLHILYITLVLGGIVSTMIGILTFFYWVKPAKKPADTSNRINNISSWWIGMTRPDVMAKSYRYFQQDVMDNIEEVEESDK